MVKARKWVSFWPLCKHYIVVAAIWSVTYEEQLESFRHETQIAVAVRLQDNKWAHAWYKLMRNIKGVLHPRPVFGLFLHFSQKLQQIGNK